MKFPLLICALCLALVAGVSSCGGDDATSSETQGSGSATTTDDSAATGSEGNTTPDDGPLETPPSKVLIGDYEAEGPFAAVSGGKGNEKPRFDPSGQPAPKKTVIRDLDVGSGPAAQRGDEVSIYYVGADYATGKVQYYGWPPYRPATFELGLGTFGKSWERNIEGMKVGGTRQVIITTNAPLDYVIVLTALRPQSEKP